MLELNNSYLKAGWLLDKVHYPASTITAILKGTYDLRNGAAATPSDAQLEIQGDVYESDDPGKSLIYSSDVVPFKPHTDVLLVGSACSPNGQPVSSVQASFSIAGRRKHLTVTGDRYWVSEFLPTRPEPFLTLNLGYQNSFGGVGFDRNPIGKGRSETRSPNGVRLFPCPNVELLGREVTSSSDFREPAGFGPLPLMWPQRLSKSGTYDDSWLRNRWPSPPANFDWAFHNAAPFDQQFVPYLRGDESLRLENLRPNAAVYECSLPAVRVRCFYADVIGAPISFAEVNMALDTIWINSDSEKLVLVWRGVSDLRTAIIGKLDWLVVATENMADPPRPIEYYEELARKDAAFLDRKTVTVPVAVQPAPQALAPLPAAPPAAKDTFLEQYARGQSFHGQDLTGVDFSSCFLEGADFSNAILTETFFRRARLAGANFAGAVVTRADFSGSDLRAANFSSADANEARLPDANLSSATVHNADFTRANLRNAKLEQAQGKRAIFRKADLFRAKLKGASFEEADFSQAELHESDFSGATLTNASIEEASAFPIYAKGSNIAGLRASDAVLWQADFRDCVATGSIWQRAELQRATFAGSDLTKAEFDRANLTGANFSHAILRAARLQAVSLRAALLDSADLFDASIADADLTGASLVRASLYGVESLGCVVEGADFTGANRKHTLWEVNA